jgi:hypothetical protein
LITASLDSLLLLSSFLLGFQIIALVIIVPQSLREGKARVTAIHFYVVASDSRSSRLIIFAASLIVFIVQHDSTPLI